MTVEQLHKQHGDYLLRCLRFYGVPVCDAEDVRQDIYLALLTRKHDIRDERVRGFCSKIAKNAAESYRRKQECRIDEEPLFLLGPDGCETMHPVVDQLSTERWSEQLGGVASNRIEAAAELATSYIVADGITAFELLSHVIYGLSYEQIADIYNTTPAIVRGWLQRWRKHAREQIPK